MTETKGQDSAFRTLLQSRNFLLLWIGEAISLIGDQFYMIALPWLTLQITGDAFAMGMVLATGGIPRALFMLVGGAVTDRFSPRNVMLISNLLRMILVALLAILVIIEAIQLWMIYLFALVFGLVDAFFFPAQNSIVPNLAKSEHLQTANAIVMMTQHLSLFGGPILAGALIALLSQQQGATGASDLRGIGVAFAIDALTFLASAITLWFIRIQKSAKQLEDNPESMVNALKAGLQYVQGSPTLRSVFTLIIFANVLVAAPFTVGIPVLADTRLAEGAAAFGIIMSAFGGGTLLGMAAGGMLPRPSDRSLGIILLTVWSTMGIGTLLMGLTTTTPAAAFIGASMGVTNGYVTIVFITWLQSTTPDAMLGRMMSFFGFATVGLAPIANALLGAAISYSLVWAFVGAGGLMTTFVLLAMMVNPALRHLDEHLVVAGAVGD